MFEKALAILLVLMVASFAIYALWSFLLGPNSRHVHPGDGPSACPVCATGAPWAADKADPDDLCDDHAQMHALVRAHQQAGRQGRDCPNDTDGDGHCGAWRTCPFCGPAPTSRL